MEASTLSAKPPKVCPAAVAKFFNQPQAALAALITVVTKPLAQSVTPSAEPAKKAFSAPQPLEPKAFIASELALAKSANTPETDLPHSPVHSLVLFRNDCHETDVAVMKSVNSL
ncbi:hypothetical protein D3C79_721680 [compost metagenome]